MILAPVLLPLIPGALFLLIQAVRGVPLSDSKEIIHALIDQLRPHARVATVASVVVTLFVLAMKYRSRLAALVQNRTR
jgi:hypothetical protein